MGIFDFLKKSDKELKRELDLRQLEEYFEFDEESMDRSMRRYEEEKKRLTEKYGDEWSDVYVKQHVRFVTDADRRRDANMWIYEGIEPCCPPRLPDHPYESICYQRMREVYGDAYDRLRHHKSGDPEVVELLLQDAAKTGRWDELPECLQQECQF